MYAKISLALGTALAAIALCCFVDSSLGQDALTAPVAESDSDDVDSETDSKDEKSRWRHSHKGGSQLNTTDAPWTNANENQSLAITSIETAEAEAVVVTGSFDIYPVPYPALPPVEGTRINAGKNTSFVKPQRSEFMQVLKDGISLKNEQFGFPETHYTPILDAVERIELIRAGAALQFGCQPGGALNFVMKMPRLDAPFHFTTRNVFGSYGYYRNYTDVDGTVGPFGYYLYYDHRQQDGFREANSDYELNNGSSRLVWDVTKDSQFILTLDFYDENHGEPGGMRRREEVNPPNSVFVEDGFTQSSRFFDRFRLERYYAMLEYQKFFSERTELEIKAFGGYLSRWSKRQRGGGFGTLPSGPDASTNSIQLREAWTEGVDARVRHDYDLFNNVSTIAGGIYFYHALQDRTDERGETPDAESGMLRNLNTGETWDGAIFAENRFHFGRLSIVPGMRLEFLNLSVDEEVNVSNPLHSQADFNFVPLFGFGLGYVLVDGQPILSAPPVAGEKGAETKNPPAPIVTTGGPPRVELY